MWLPFFPSSYPFSSFYQHLVSTPYIVCASASEDIAQFFLSLSLSKFYLPACFFVFSYFFFHLHLLLRAALDIESVPDAKSSGAAYSSGRAFACTVCVYYIYISSLLFPPHQLDPDPPASFSSSQLDKTSHPPQPTRPFLYTLPPTIYYIVEFLLLLFALFLFLLYLCHQPCQVISFNRISHIYTVL